MDKKEIIGHLSTTVMNGILKNNFQYGGYFMGDAKRKTYNRGCIDGRVEIINEIESLIIKLCGEDYLKKLYKSYRIEYEVMN